MKTKVVPLASVRCTTTMSSFGKFYAGVIRRQSLVVPLADFPQEDVSQDRAAEFQILRNAGDVVDRHHGAQDSRKVQNLTFERGNLCVRHGHVGSAEIDGPSSHVFDAAARAIGVVVDLHAGVSGVILGRTTFRRSAPGRSLRDALIFCADANGAGAAASRPTRANVVFLILISRLNFHIRLLQFRY